MKTIFLALLLATAAADDPVPVYLVTPGAQFVDAALKDRIDSTKDLRDIRWDKKLVRFVDTPAEALVVLEVTSRGTGTTDERRVTRDIVTGQVKSDGQATKSVIVKLTVGEYATDIIGQSQQDQLGIMPSWSSAAIDARSKVQKWIKDNRAKLTPAR